MPLSVRRVSSARDWRRETWTEATTTSKRASRSSSKSSAAVGADLELAAVEQPEALGRRLGRRRPGRLLGGVRGVERGDDLGLLGDPVGRQPAGDRERLRVVGQDLVGVAAPPGVVGHDLDRKVAVGPVGVAVQVAAQVGQVDELRQAAGQGSLDLAAVLAQLRDDERQAEERVRLVLGGERAQLGGIAGQRLAVLADPQEALLRQAPAAVAGHRAEPDVVLLGPGEVDPVGPRLARWHDHQVGLRPAHQPDGRLVAALVDDRIDEPERGERLDQRLRLVGLGEDVEIADRLLPAPERAGRLHRPDARRRRQRVDQRRDGLLGAVEAHPVEPLVELGDPLEDQRLGLGRHPAQAPQAAVLGGLAQVVDGLDAELRVELADGLRSEPGDAQQLDEARRDLRPEAVVVGHVAGRRQLEDLVADRLADARDLGRRSRTGRPTRRRPGCGRWRRPRGGRRPS